MTDPNPPLIAFEPGSFADFTLRERLPRIVDAVARDPQHSAVARSQLTLLRATLPNGAVPDAIGHASTDRSFWKQYMQSFQGAPWRAVPFMQAEFMFYRALLDALLCDSDPGRDPFAGTKQAALENARNKLPSAAEQARALTNWNYESLRDAVHWALTGNAADLSQLERSDHGDAQQQPLVDDLAEVFSEISPDSAGTIDLVLDNAGEELIGDLVLIDYLLSAHARVALRIHVKPDPIFVSDVTPADWRITLDFICAQPAAAVASWGQKLVDYQRVGRLMLRADPFWCRPLCLSELDLGLREQLAESRLMILKGDLNYRRYLQDRTWPLDSPASAHRIPTLAPALALRVMKSELAVGLSQAVVSQLQPQEPDWLYNGRHAIVQYFR